MTSIVPHGLSLPAPFRVDEDSLVVEEGVRFNAWRDAGDQLVAAESTTQWLLGDWWAAGQRLFGLDYIPALDQLATRHPTLLEYARVARAFPRRSESDALRPSPGEEPGVWRVSGVPFSLHRVCAAISDGQERMAWIEDAARHGWTKRQLEAELAASYAKGHPRSVDRFGLTLRAGGEVALRCQARADKLGVHPKELALAVLDLAFQLEDPIGALEAAGAVMSELEAA